MENQHSKIDEIFRQRLHDSEVPPPPFVWPAVEQELQKRRRKGLFLWLFAFGTASACVLFWQFGTWHKTTSGPLLTSEVLSQSKELETDLATPTSDSKISSPGQSTVKAEGTAAELPADVATQASQASKESAKKASHLNASEFKNESKRASNAPKIIFSPKGAPAEEKSTISNPAKEEEKPDVERLSQIKLKAEQKSKEAIQKISTFNASIAKETLERVAAELSIGTGKILQAVRLCITGAGAGPDLMMVMEIIGAAEVASRIDYALHTLKVKVS